MKRRLGWLAPGVVVLVFSAMMHVGCEQYYRHYVEDAQKQQQEQEQQGDSGSGEDSGGSSQSSSGSGWEVTDVDGDWDLDLDDDDGHNVFGGNLKMNLDVDSDGDIDGSWTRGTVIDGKVYANHDIKLKLRDNGTGDVFELKGKVSENGNTMNGSWDCDTLAPPDDEGDWDAKED